MSKRKNHAPRRKRKQQLAATSVMPLCLTAGFFLGFGLGALMQELLLVIGIGLLAGAVVGYLIDRRNGIAYTRRDSR
ncbi:MAG: hypothetical protein WEB57_10750 [Pseudohongiellaceae bacterium]